MKPRELSMRDALAQALIDLGGRVPELVVLDADVSSSTKTAAFGKAYPDRFFNVGVAEANMIDIAAGMATCGLRPAVSSFSLFLVLKGLDQISSVLGYNRLPVVLLGGYGGLSGSFEGASHHAINDLAALRAIPDLAIVVPGDASEVAPALEAALRRDGPTYLRLGRNPSPVLLEGAEPSRFGKVRRLGLGKDLSIAVCGIPLAMTVEAVAELARDGISVDLLQVSTLKPLDVQALCESAARTGAMLTVEEHNVLGGLGSSVAHALASRGQTVVMDFVGINDCFTESGPYWELLAKHDLSSNAIARRARALLESIRAQPRGGARRLLR